MHKFLFTFFLLAPLFNSCGETKYNVALIGHEHCSFASQTDTAVRGHNYIVKTQLDRGYSLIEEYIKITVGDFELIPVCYVFNKDDNTILVKGEYVTNNIKIEILDVDLKGSSLDFEIGSGYIQPTYTYKHYDIDITFDPKSLTTTVVPEVGKNVNPAIKVIATDGDVDASKYEFKDNKDEIRSYTFSMNDKNEFYRDIKVIIPNAVDIVV